MSVSSSPTSAPAPAQSTADVFGFGTVPTNAPSLLAPSTNTSPVFPGSSLSPYFLSQIGTNQIDLGGAIANGGSMTIDQAISVLDHLPQSELLQIESMLWSAGFYTDANGNPLKTAPVLGTLDDQGRRAWVNALIAAYSTGGTVTDTINQAISSGEGANLRSTLPSAVTGGGNVYTIDLTQPGAVNGTANSIFQAALGRNATPDEMSRITDAMNSGAISQGLAKEQGAEMSSQQQYQARVNQRNIQYQYETTPKQALGAVPAGPANNPQEYATNLLQYMGMPVTQSNVAFLTGWINANGAGMQGMNPLGSQNATPGSTPTQTATPSYTSWDQSYAATAAALQSGSYTNVVAALQQGDAASAVGNKAVQSEIKKWSGSQYSDISSATSAAMAVAGQQVQVIQQQQQTQTPAVPQQTAMQGTAASTGANGGGPGPGPAPPAPNMAPNSEGTAQSTGAEGGGPTNQPATAAADVTPGQQQTNPGDQYVNPVTVFSQNPLSADQASYDAATTGANRFSFGENNFLKAFLAVADMISKGGPTG